MSDLDAFWVHTATIETFTGAGAYGDVFASPVTVSCFVDPSRRLIRNANGEQVVSESTLYTPVTNAALFTNDSRVTVNGVVARVVKVNTLTSGVLDLPDHTAINLI